jgi:hypothetical protein
MVLNQRRILLAWRKRLLWLQLRLWLWWLCLRLHHLESMPRFWHHLITGGMVAHNMSRMGIMPGMSNWPEMKDLLLMGTLMLRRVQPSFVAREIHVSRMRLCGDGTRGSSTSTKVARLVWVLLAGRILVPVVLQEGAVWEQRLGVPVRCDGRH